nr:hypothetical protein [Mycoplasmopsis bovis]
MVPTLPGSWTLSKNTTLFPNSLVLDFLRHKATIPSGVFVLVIVFKTLSLTITELSYLAVLLSNSYNSITRFFL